VPQLVVPPAAVAAWRQVNDLGQTSAMALARGSVGASKRWTSYAEAAKMFAEQGADVWVVVTCPKLGQFELEFSTYDRRTGTRRVP
jgi:hypothetical protein